MSILMNNMTRKKLILFYYIHYYNDDIDNYEDGIIFPTLNYDDYLYGNWEYHNGND